MQRLFLPHIQCRSDQLIPHMAIIQDPQTDRRHLYKTTPRTPAHSKHHKVHESSKMAKTIWYTWTNSLLIHLQVMQIHQQILSKLGRTNSSQIHLQTTQIHQQILSKLGRTNLSQIHSQIMQICQQILSRLGKAKLLQIWKKMAPICQPTLIMQSSGKFSANLLKVNTNLLTYSCACTNSAQTHQPHTQIHCKFALLYC